ncbi:hypothetical protein BAN20980_05933 [Burkholderia anthina]|uniref:Uncharacterized protein n=1 Tax=Burkholderia anthina TaxID=179879 RepID=A0A6P2GK91_9BURK|nr:hypothetical protein BAN20980_05933 [Burkholderia anthina]
MEETVPTIHTAMVRCNISSVKNRQDGDLSQPHCSKSVTG